MAGKSRPRARGDSAALPAARARAILQERTQRLAARSAAAEPARAPLRALLCSLGGNLYGLPLDSVRKVRPLQHLGAAPVRHPATLGLVVEEGRIRAALDLAVLLGAPTPGDVQEGWLVVLAPPATAVLRVPERPLAVDAEPLDGPDPARARVLEGEHRDQVLVMLSPAELLAPSHLPTHGASAS